MPLDSVESDEAEISGTSWDLPYFLVKFGLVPVESYVTSFVPPIVWVSSLDQVLVGEVCGLRGTLSSCCA